MPDKQDSQDEHDNHDVEHAAIDNGADLAHAAMDEAHSAGRKTAETGRESARRAVHLTEEFAGKSRENFAEGMRALADACAPLAEAGEDARRRLLEASSHVSDACLEAADDSAEDVQALTSSYLQLGRGLLRLQQGYLSMIQQSFSDVRHQPRDLLTCKSVADFADVQRGFYLDGVNFLVQSSSMLMELTGHAVQEAAAPLQSRAAQQV